MWGNCQLRRCLTKGEANSMLSFSEVSSPTQSVEVHSVTNDKGLSGISVSQSPVKPQSGSTLSSADWYNSKPGINRLCNRQRLNDVSPVAWRDRGPRDSLWPRTQVAQLPRTPCVFTVWTRSPEILVPSNAGFWGPLVAALSRILSWV